MTTTHKCGECGGTYRLTRLRVNPEKLRVAVRPDGAWWLATIKSRSGTLVCIQVRHKHPVKAVVKALRRADQLGVEGVDLGMEWAYPYPWR